MGHIRNVCRMPKCNLIGSHIPTADENSSPIYTLQTTEPNGQFVFAPLRFESGVEHRFIMDTGSSESILPNSALTAICPNAVLAPTTVRIDGVTSHQLQLLGETMLCAQSESGMLIPIRFLCSGNVGGMKVPWVKLEVDGEPIFIKRRILPYGQREGVLKALQNMEQDGVISKVESSAWATPILVAMK
ncbi:unnamed protein product [Echinostoma caproni]|uniref:Peptidase A2 domain-containing protein n=1 Tax=Echinostoma caproni TaxID=27848 RepID=A0A183AKS7_9TREM|nr:unnamed protein product [Echinostoma caproni]